MNFKEKSDFINHFYLRIDLDDYAPDFRKSISPDSYLGRVLNVFKYTFFSVLKLIIGLFQDKKIGLSSKVIWTISHNNLNATKFLCDADNKFVFLSPYNNSVKSKLDNPVLFTYTFELFFKALHLVNFIVYVSGNKQKIRLFDFLFKGIGLYEESRRYLKKLNPRVVVFSNDHSPQSRALLLACIHLKIKTVYIQHASINVNTPFPPLSFGLSLLEGQMAFETYSSQGEIGNYTLIGMPKLDGYKGLRRTESHDIKVIGLAYSDNDEVEIVERVVNKLMNELGFQIIVRPHPADSRKLSNVNLTISNSREENSFEFINKIDFLIASDSSIHLESCLMNVQSLFMKMNRTNTNDSYRFVENGICKYTSSENDIARELDNFEFRIDHYWNSKKYVENVDIASIGAKLKIINEINDFIA